MRLKIRLTGLCFLIAVALTDTGFTQTNMICGRAIGHTPFYDRIFIPKGNLLRPPTLRGVDDLEPGTRFPETNRTDLLFANVTRERTNGYYAPCLPEVPSTGTSVRCTGNLLSLTQAYEFLRHTVAVPRTSWTNHFSQHAGFRWSKSRYVASLIASDGRTFILDLRGDSCGILYFPDGTYRCLMDRGYHCLKIP